MKKKAALILVLFLGIFTNISAQNDADFQELQKLVEAILQTRELPIEFNPKSIQISASSSSNLKKHAELLKQIPNDTVVEIGVYAQTTGNNAALLQLTQQRAEKFKQTLVLLGVNANILTAKGYGIAKPTDPDAQENQVEYVVRKSKLINYHQNATSQSESKIIAGIGFDKLIIGASQADIESILGKPDFAQSRSQDEFVSSFYNKGIVVVYEQPAMKVKILRFIGDGNLYGGTSVKFQSFQGKPDKNLTWGASVSQVIDAYGSPNNRESHEDFKTKLEIVNLEFNGTTFIFKGDKLFQINVTASNNSTKNIPQLTKEEKEKLSQELVKLAKVKDINPEIIREMIKKGADVNYIFENTSALYNASDYERTEIAKILLEAGANPNLVVGIYNSNPLIAAIQTRNVELVRLMVEKYKADVNHQTSIKRTPLIVAAEFNYDDKITNILLANGADPNKFNDYDKNALTIARNRKQTEIVSALEKATTVFTPPSKTSSSNSESTSSNNSGSSSSSNRNSALVAQAESEYQQLYSRLQQLDQEYSAEVTKIQRQIEKDRKSGVQANLFMNAERRRAQAKLDEAHRIIKAFLKKYSSVLSDDLKETLEDWDERLPTYISI